MNTGSCAGMRFDTGIGMAVRFNQDRTAAHSQSCQDAFCCPIARYPIKTVQT